MNLKPLKKHLLSASVLIGSLVSYSATASQEAIKAYENQELANAKMLFNQSLDNNKNDSTALHYLAKIALNESELDEAEEYIEKAKELSPENARIHFDAARIMGAQAQDSSMFSAPGYAKNALKSFKRAAELEPETIDYRRGLMSFYLQAPGFLGGDEKLAMQEANAIEKLDPVKGFMALANVYQSTGASGLLEQHYSSVDGKLADNANVLFSRGLYYQTLEEYGKALADFRKIQTLERASEEDHTNYAALYQVGRSSVLSESNHKEGIDSLNQYIKTAPESDQLPSKAWAKYRLGILFKQTGDKKSAKTLYKEAQQETKDKQLLKSLKKSIKKL